MFPLSIYLLVFFRPLAGYARRRETLKRAVMAGEIPQAGSVFHYKTLKV
jgi:hypothetical protein